MTQLDFLLWLQSFRSPWLDAAVTGTAADNLITFIAPKTLPATSSASSSTGAWTPW